MTRYDELRKELTAHPRTWLVTGAAGFIGSNLVERLLELDQRVVGLDNFATGHRENLDDVRRSVGEERAARFTFYEADIRKLEDCRKAAEGVDLVLHQAALGSVPRSVEDPVGSNATNVDGFINMLIAARDAGVKRFVYASSSSVYGDDPSDTKREDRTGRVISPYAATKAANELYADAFGSAYGFETIGLRYFNVFGARQDPNGAYAAVIPKWTQLLLDGKDCVLFGEGNKSRDFCYIDNTVQANLLAATADAEAVAGRVYNVAIGERTTLQQLFEMLREHSKAYTPAAASASLVQEAPRTGDIPHSLAEIDHIARRLGYAPTHDIVSGLKETVRWYAARAGDARKAGVSKPSVVAVA